MNKLITFEDHGQDFLTFEVDPDGKIVDVQPFQYSIWSKWWVKNKRPKIGTHITLERYNGHLYESLKIKYPIEKIESLI